MDNDEKKPAKSKARIRRGLKSTGGLPQEWKDKISATKIMQRLMGCIDGDIQLTSQQIKAAEIILRKVIPDVARQEVQNLDKDGNPADAVSKVEVVLVNRKD